VKRGQRGGRVLQYFSECQVAECKISE
jgi:hypothetical protein